MRRPRSTYRLQVNADFKLSRVRELIDYFADLGISDLYLSPLLQARPGSTHGYDVTDPAQVNPEIGSTAELELLSADLRACNMGILLDIVPNHMAASEENPGGAMCSSTVPHRNTRTTSTWTGRPSCRTRPSSCFQS
jgi:(1->4)-alpha-D-glucan 1-alpha-D-glucosylmutase